MPSEGAYGGGDQYDRGELDMADRMARVWSPTTTGGVVTLAAGGFMEMPLIPSTALLLTQDRLMRDWTVTRIVGRMDFDSAGNSSMYYGIRVANENETGGMINPGADPTADWMLWGGIDVWNCTYQGACGKLYFLDIDNRSQRKSRGMESELRLYVYNAGGSVADVSWTGRTLVLVP